MRGRARQLSAARTSRGRSARLPRHRLPGAQVPQVQRRSAGQQARADCQQQTTERHQRTVEVVELFDCAEKSVRPRR